MINTQFNPSSSLFNFQIPNEKKLQLCRFICWRDNCIYLCRQLLGKLAMNEMSLPQWAPCWDCPQPGRTADHDKRHKRFAYICFFFTSLAGLTPVIDTANMTNMKTLTNLGGSFPPAVSGRECEDESLQHLVLLSVTLVPCCSAAFGGWNMFFKRKQATSCWVSGCHGYSSEFISPLLICVMVSITYQEELVIQGYHANKSPFSADRLRWKGGRGVQLEIMLVCEVKMSATLSSVNSDSDCHTAGLFLQTTVKTLQQMDVTLWSGKHFAFQNNECFVQRRINSILAAGWLMMSQKRGKSLGRTHLWDRHTFCINLYKQMSFCL